MGRRSARPPRIHVSGAIRHTCVRIAALGSVPKGWWAPHPWAGRGGRLVVLHSGAGRSCARSRGGGEVRTFVRLRRGVRQRRREILRLGRRVRHEAMLLDLAVDGTRAAQLVGRSELGDAAVARGRRSRRPSEIVDRRWAMISVVRPCIDLAQRDPDPRLGRRVDGGGRVVENRGLAGRRAARARSRCAGAGRRRA